MVETKNKEELRNEVRALNKQIRAKKEEIKEMIAKKKQIRGNDCKKA